MTEEHKNEDDWKTCKDDKEYLYNHNGQGIKHISDKIEQWKNINEYENYMISNWGRVKNINDKNRDYMKNNISDTKEYPTVKLSKNCNPETFYVHILVATYFLEKPKDDKKYIVDHINRNKNNYNYNNLRWATLSENGMNREINHWYSIYQYDPEGNLIDKFDNIKEVLKNEKFKEWGIRNSYRKNVLYKGYLWTKKDIKEIEKIDENEEFFPINVPNKDFSKYVISKNGNIKNIEYYGEKIEKMVPKSIKNGYYRVTLLDKLSNKTYYMTIHRLVAYTFVENKDPTNNIIINHLDENKLNNNFKNLEWITTKENIIYSMAIKVYQYTLDNQYITYFDSIAEAQEICEVYNISECCNGKFKTAGNFIWKLTKDEEKKNIDEEWKNVQNKDYQISNYGNARLNGETNKYIKTHKDEKGYLCIEKKTKIYKLVAKLFVENKEKFKSIMFKDNNIENIYYKNLEWYKNKGKKIIRKPILQLNKDTLEIIKKWNGITDICKTLHCDKKTVKKYILNKEEFKNCLWKYEVNENIDKKDFVNIKFKDQTFKNFFINKQGIIINDKNVILKHVINENSLFVSMNSVSYKVCLLLGYTFLTKKDDDYTIIFKDKNFQNLNIDNLFWIKSEQEMHAINKCKKISQYDKNGLKIKQFNSLKDAVADTGFSKSGLSQAANGKLKMSNGFIWKYE